MQFGHDWPAFVPTNGIQASYIELDCETGIIRPLQHWAVDDFGRIINPRLVAEQVRGGIAQGIGEALLEELKYDKEGQLLSGSPVDYLLPKSDNIPDIWVDHVETPWPYSELGTKGAGEAGAGAC
jgi:aerobic carbon-monoxide dehydrogenase large subunit